MRSPWRPLVLAAVSSLVAAASATAQSVIVTKAPPGAAIELVVNSTAAGTATADAAGQATMAFTMEPRGGKTEADTYLFVEFCGELRRVILVEPGAQAPPAGECVRREIPGVYVVRKVTTLVVNLSEASPSVLVRQGKAPVGWLTEEVERRPSEKPANAPSRGLYGFGAGGFTSFSSATTVACGTDECSGSTKPLAFSAGATFWLTPFLAIEGSYLKPGDLRLTSANSAYEFVSTLQSDVVTVVGKLGLPLAYVRPYGFGGATFSRVTWKISQTMLEQTYLIDEVETVVPGGTQTFRLYTQGWSWVGGGGLEVPVSKRAMLFGEVGWAGIKGDNRQGGEGTINERVIYLIGGIRIRILG